MVNIKIKVETRHIRMKQKVKILQYDITTLNKYKDIGQKIGIKEKKKTAMYAIIIVRPFVYTYFDPYMFFV